MLTARALYSNVADSPEELSFSQGDILRVLERDVNGLTGWWLCSVNGQNGIAPGNRLQPITTTQQTDDGVETPRRAKSAVTKGTVDKNGSVRQDWHRADKVRPT